MTSTPVVGGDSAALRDDAGGAYSTGHTASTPSLRVLFASAEALPFAKVGGLADFSGGLPQALAALGHEVRLVLPAYLWLGGRPLMTLDVPLGGITERVHVKHLARRGGVDVLTVGSAGWYDHEVPYSYRDADVLPFVLFSKAITALAADARWRPDVIHGNDWHCGLIPQEVQYGEHREALQRTAVVFTIHNLAYQGATGYATDRVIGLPSAGSMLARGIEFADQVNTVSPNYLTEILTPARGAGLDALLRSRGPDVHGILNGVDYQEFTPEQDPRIAARYDGSFVTGKRANKQVLQQMCGLEPDPARPLVGMISRLVPQKGVGLVCSALNQLTTRGAQVVVVGEGDVRFHRALRSAAGAHPGSVAFQPTSQEAMARQVYASSDLLLAPSTFEPCGLTPLIGLRYGSIPVVRRTGGMSDTISDYTLDPERGLGFVFEHRRVASLVSAVDAALSVFANPPEWQALQRRAMAADFSWRKPAAEYVALYERAVDKRRSRSWTGSSSEPARPERPAPMPLPLALVHHANQFLITNGYDDREGITALVDGYTALLKLHEKYRFPTSLHLSGTLIEAAAWHHPEFLRLVRGLRERGIVHLIGGAYAENVLPAFDHDFNRRQLEELLWLYEHHLGCPPGEIDTCWIPERVWDTERLAGLLTSPDLPNGGYRHVLLDDRLLYPTGGRYVGSDRERFDDAAVDSPPPADALRPYRIADGHGLEVVPMSTRIRQWVPPETKAHWRGLARITDLTAAPGDDMVLVYADDMEKTAGVGPWTATALSRYEAFLRWVAAHPTLSPVALSPWLAERQRASASRAIDAGTFVELARDWKAGESYEGWLDHASWAPYRRHLERARVEVDDAQRSGADPALLKLAWKHLLASAYETAWRDTNDPGHPPAPWSRAVASHAAAALLISAAARWFGERHATASARVVDIDEDGEPEVILANDHLFAVISPSRGGRLTYLAHRRPSGGVLVVGNPTDDWNWQESLHRYMDQPANHPGALADVGFVHDGYDVSTPDVTGGALVELLNVAEQSDLRGAHKRILLPDDGDALVVAYELPHGCGGLTVETCLSPHYYQLLRRGRQGLRRDDGAQWRGARNGPVAVWLAGDDEEITWAEEPGEAGHGLSVRAHARTRSFHLVLGVGAIDAERCHVVLADARTLLDRVNAQPMGASEG